MKAFRIPTGINGVIPVRTAVFQDKEAAAFSQRAPQTKVTTIPSKLAMMA